MTNKMTLTSQRQGAFLSGIQKAFHKRSAMYASFAFQLIIAVALVARATAANIDPDNDGSMYAWGENVGWINFGPSQGPGVVVTSSGLTGYAWGENIGWINLDSATNGVVNDGNGNLSGYAWGENVGWINFAPTVLGVRIDSSGVFSGQAWGENIGWISFSSDGPVLFKVKTSWKAPFLVTAQVTPVPAQTMNQNPSYTFSSTEAGAITYGGSCGSASTSAAVGNNTITLTAVGGGPLANGTYNNCTITVTDGAGHVSATLVVNQFMVDTAGQYLWAKIERTGDKYSSLQEAYNATVDTDVVRARAATLPEDLSFAGNRKIKLRGGYDSSFSTNAGGFTTTRSLSIGGPGSGNGGLTIENVMIE